jgi:hypothetical protein
MALVLHDRSSLTPLGDHRRRAAGAASAPNTHRHIDGEEPTNASRKRRLCAGLTVADVAIRYPDNAGRSPWESHHSRHADNPFFPVQFRDRQPTGKPGAFERD